LKVQQTNCRIIVCSRGAAVVLSGKPCYYELQNVDPRKCVGELVKQ